MNSIKSFLFALLGTLLLLATPLAQAENVQQFGDYHVYYNAFNADYLSPEIARNYNIERSSRRAVLNVVVRKSLGNGKDEPIAANITGTATNLNAQLRSLTLREVKEGSGAIYYLADFPITSQETLDFNLKITPQGSTHTFDVKFRQQFYVQP